MPETSFWLMITSQFTNKLQGKMIAATLLMVAIFCTTGKLPNVYILYYMYNNLTYPACSFAFLQFKQIPCLGKGTVALSASETATMDRPAAPEW